MPTYVNGISSLRVILKSRSSFFFDPLLVNSPTHVKFIWNSKITMCCWFHGCVKSGENWVTQMHLFPVEVGLGKSLPYYFSSHARNSYPFLWSLHCHFLKVILLFKEASKHSTEVLASVPKLLTVFLFVHSKKAVICLTYKISILDKFCPGMSYDTLGCESSVDKSAVYIQQGSLNKNTCKIRFYIDWSMKMLWPEFHRNLILCFSRKKWFRIH